MVVGMRPLGVVCVLFCLRAATAQKTAGAHDDDQANLGNVPKTASPAGDSPEQYCMASGHVRLMNDVEHSLEKLDDLVQHPPFKNMPETLTSGVKELRIEGLKNFELDDPLSKECTKEGQSVKFSVYTDEPVKIALTRTDLPELSVEMSSPSTTIEGTVTRKKDCDSTCIVDECFIVRAKVVEAGEVKVQLPNLDPQFQRHLATVRDMLAGQLNRYWKIALESAFINAVRRGLVV